MPRMGRVVAPPAGTVANTSHCKSPVESREPLEGLSHCSGGFQDQPWCSAGSRPPPTTVSKALKNSLPFTWSLKKEKKKRKSGVLIAPVETLQLSSSSSKAQSQGREQHPRALFIYLFSLFLQLHGWALMPNLPAELKDRFSKKSSRSRQLPPEPTRFTPHIK